MAGRAGAGIIARRGGGGEGKTPARPAESARSVKRAGRRSATVEAMTPPTEQTYRQRILRVQLFIQQHLDEELSLERLARVAHFSPYHFHRIFRELVGEGVNEHVRRLRLEAAAVALKTTGRGVTQIALDAGYGAHEAFTRAFRQMFGVSPSQFRAGRHPVFNPKEATMTTETTPREVRIETVPPRRVAFVRHVGPYREVKPTFDRLAAWAGRRGLFRPDTLVIGISYDDPEVTPADKIRVDCCLTVGEDVAPEGEVGVQTIPGGECAVLTHHGPYRELGQSFGWLYGVWLPASGREPRDAPAYTVARLTPPDTPPEQLRTDIHLPLEPR
jgi:AraC family transcriptional regulator